MPGFTDLSARGLVSEEFADEAERFFTQRSRILILVDGRIEVLPVPFQGPGIEPGTDFGIAFSFGISAAIATLKNFSMGSSSFAVTVATRNGDGSPISGHDITGYRFSEDSLKAFDQVWMFGFHPGNFDANNLDPALDARIEQGPGQSGAPVNALTIEELAALARWMDNGGGVFATGDHHLLGASMCHKVPRVSAMRRWTIADGVPTIELETRFDTTQPQTLEQKLGLAVIGEGAESDFLPQRTDWVSFTWHNVGGPRRPHVLLCHPKHGPIDVLPDHPHEGLCFDFNDPGWATKRDQTFDFAGYANAQFPTLSNYRPLPQVVTWGTTLADPPLQFFKRDQALRRFPQIAAYDGQAIAIGRVVVDSTWHHWFDMNLTGIEAQTRKTGDRRNFDCILRYYVNVGIYLASSSWRANQIYEWLKVAQLGYFGQEAVNLNSPAAEIGRIALAYLQPHFGLCGTTEFVLDRIQQADETIWRALKDAMSRPPQSRLSLTFEQVELAVLGEIVRALYSDMGELDRQTATKGRIHGSPVLPKIEELVLDATRHGLAVAFDEQRADLELAGCDLAKYQMNGSTAAL